MTWYYEGQPVTELPADCEAFVYIITNLENGRKYVGKKLAKFKKSRPPLKGKTRRRIEWIESDWRNYWGSSDHLNQDVAHLGAEKFRREILHYCPSRGVASYLEMLEQVKRNVLASDDYYNGIINVRISSSEALRETLKNLGNIL